MGQTVQQVALDCRAQILGESTGSIAAGSTGSSGLGSNLGMRSKKAALLRASLAPSSRVTRAGAAAAQAVGSGTNFRAAPGASMPAHTGRSSPSKQAPAGRLQPPASAHPAAVQQLEGAALAALIMQVICVRPLGSKTPLTVYRPTLALAPPMRVTGTDPGCGRVT